MALVMGMLGGLALFLYGMERMGDALKVVAGDRLKDILRALTTNRFMGLITGTITTAIVQSSSVTTVLLVGFVSAGLMSLSQSIGIILGADIGTTVTAQIISFNVKQYAPMLLAMGFVLYFVGVGTRVRHYGTVVMGTGFIFLGMGLMSDAMHPLRGYPPFIDAMVHMDNPWLAVALSTAFTALVQSSAATIGVVLVLASQGVITLEAGIALALGANIGTCATAGLAAIGKPRDAVRVALAHVLFKILGVLLILPFLTPFTELVRALSPGGDTLAEQLPRQIANAHTIFNVGVAFLFLPFTTYFARFLMWALPPLPAGDPRRHRRPSAMSAALLQTPVLALEASGREVRHLGALVQHMVDHVMPTVLTGSSSELDALEHQDVEVDRCYEELVTYIGQISRSHLDQTLADEVLAELAVVNELEAIGDVVERDLVALGRRRMALGVNVSPGTNELLTALHALVAEALRDALVAFEHDSRKHAKRVVRLKGDLNEFVHKVETHQATRLAADAPNRLAAYTLEMEIIDKLGRVYHHARRLAKAVARKDVTEVE